MSATTAPTTQTTPAPGITQQAAATAGSWLEGAKSYFNSFWSSLTTTTGYSKEQIKNSIAIAKLLGLHTEEAVNAPEDRGVVTSQLNAWTEYFKSATGQIQDDVESHQLVLIRMANEALSNITSMCTSKDNKPTAEAVNATVDTAVHDMRGQIADWRQKGALMEAGGIPPIQEKYIPVDKKMEEIEATLHRRASELIALYCAPPSASVTPTPAE